MQTNKESQGVRIRTALRALVDGNFHMASFKWNYEQSNKASSGTR